MRLRRVIEAACVAAASTAALSGCCFGRSYGPMKYTRSVEVDPAVARQAAADRTLSKAACSEICTPILRDDDTLVGCRLGAPSSSSSAPSSAAASPVVQCITERPGGCDTNINHGRDTATRRTSLTARGDETSWIVRAAQQERVAVRAFDELAAELVDIGAPRRLVRAARRARSDEARHARAMTRLARARGARVPRLRFDVARKRSLEDLALENAIEGCVREVFAAAVASYQRRAAALPDLRSALEPIARDEVRHAELSLRIFAWSAPRLDEPARARVATAMARAVLELLDAKGWDEASTRGLGLPGRDATRAMTAYLEREVWAPLRVTLTGSG